MIFWDWSGSGFRENGTNSAELWPVGAASFQAEHSTAVFIPGDTNSILKRAEFFKCPSKPGCFITNDPAGCSQAGWVLQSSTKTFLGLHKLPVKPRGTAAIGASGQLGWDEDWSGCADHSLE